MSGQNLLALKNKAFLSKDPERANSFALWPVPTSYTLESMQIFKNAKKIIMKRQ